MFEMQWEWGLKRSAVFLAYQHSHVMCWGELYYSAHIRKIYITIFNGLKQH